MSRLLDLAAVLVLAGVLSGAHAADYCSVCSTHTMCKYKQTDIGSLCVNYNSSALKQTDINAIVHRHNALRNRVARGQETTRSQPSASNMRKMVWSSELASIAQRWANQCSFQHDTCRNAADKSYVGQNIYMEATTGKLASVNWTKVIQPWYDEVKDRDGKLNVQPFSAGKSGDPVVGHYTQLVWANSYRIGCGYANFKNSKGWNARVVVCNYGPGGNVIGQKMYESGQAASKCPTGTKKDTTYTGLCAKT